MTLTDEVRPDPNTLNTLYTNIYSAWEHSVLTCPPHSACSRRAHVSYPFLCPVHNAFRYRLQMAVLVLLLAKHSYVARGVVFVP